MVTVKFNRQVAAKVKVSEVSGPDLGVVPLMQGVGEVTWAAQCGQNKLYRSRHRPSFSSLNKSLKGNIPLAKHQISRFFIETQGLSPKQLPLNSKNP